MEGMQIEKKEKVNLSDFQLIGLLGCGSFGKVYLVKKCDHITLYAMKVLEKKTVVQNKKDVEHIKAERFILEAIQQSPFLITLHFAFQTCSNLYLVMDYAIGGDLYALLRKVQRFSEATVRLCIAELVVAVEHLHKLGIIYRDIKAENILVDSDGHIILTDFGLSKIFGASLNHRAYTICGTPEYMAPEVYKPGWNGYDFAVDWWSVGVLAYELLTGCTPFRIAELANSEEDILRRIKAANPVLPPSFSESVKDFIQKLLEKNPKKRLGGNKKCAFEIRKHHFFKGINWRALRGKHLQAPFKTLVNCGDDKKISCHEFALEFPIDIPTTEGQVRADRRFRAFSYVAPQHCPEKCQEQINYTVECCDEPVQAPEHSNQECQQQINYTVVYCSEPVKDLPLRPITLKLGTLVGSGVFGSCYMISGRGTGKKYVAKIVSEPLYRVAEVYAMIACGVEGHKHICNYINSYRNGTDIWIVMEYLSGGDLQQLVQMTGGLSESQCCDIFCQVCDAVQYMHSKNFVHGDLKPENIVFTDKQMKHIKLVDFGAACSSEGKKWPTIQRMCLDYVPPEALEDPQGATYYKAFDIWCLGAALFAMYMGHPPFRYRYDEDVNVSVLKQRIFDMDVKNRTPRWNNAGRAMQHLVMESCMCKEPANRATIEEIMSHAFFCLQSETVHERPGIMSNVWKWVRCVVGRVAQKFVRIIGTVC